MEDDTRDTQPMDIPVFQEADDEMWLHVGDRRVERAATSSEWPPSPQPPARPSERRAQFLATVRQPPTRD